MPRDNARLNELANVLAGSLLQYLSYCSPWYPPERSGVWHELQLLAGRQRNHVEKLLELLAVRRYAPDPPAFDIGFARHHFVALGFLLGPLRDDHEYRTRKIEEGLHDLAHEAEFHAALIRIRAGEELIAEELQRLADVMEQPLTQEAR